MPNPLGTRSPVVGAFGNSYWARRLADCLEDSAVQVRCFYIGQERSLKSRPVRRWLSDKDLWSCDVLHVLGWPTLWNLWVAAQLRGVPAIYHWLGSDVSSFRTSPRWSRVAGPMLNALVTRHLADSPSLVKELRTVGIYAQVATVGTQSFDDIAVLPLPERPCALAMLRPDKFEFYGGNEVLAMARAAPDVDWLVVAHDGTGLPQLPNVTYLGQIDDMEAVYQRTTVLVRLTAHDGIAQMVLEAMARGRHVVWSYPLPHCRFARTADAALREVRAAIACDRPNTEAAAYVRRQFDPRRQSERLCKLYRALTGH